MLLVRKLMCSDSLTPIPAIAIDLLSGTFECLAEILNRLQGKMHRETGISVRDTSLTQASALQSPRTL